MYPVTMGNEFTLDTDPVTPEDKGGPRVGVGGRAFVARNSVGPIGIEIRRGDGQVVESFPHLVRAKIYGPFAADERAEVNIGALDLPAFQLDGDPRSYRMRVVAPGEPEPELTVINAFVAPEPFAPAGAFP